MQLLEIFSALDSKELSNLGHRVKEQKRPALIKLFEELKKLRSGKYQYDKEKVFKTVYGKPFDKKKDYLLKNDTRVLKQLVYRFLADEELSKEIKENEHFLNEMVLKGLKRRKVHSVFTKEVEKIIQEAEDQFNPEALSKFLQLKNQYFHDLAYASPLSEEDQLTLLDKIQNAEIKKLLYSVRKLEYMHAVTMRKYSALKNNQTYQEKTLEMEPLQLLDLDKYKDQGTYRFELVRDVYLNVGEVKLEKQKKYLNWLRQRDIHNYYSENEEVTTLNNIALSLIDLKRHDEAGRYLDQAKEHPDMINKPGSAYYHLRMLLFLRTGKYQEAINFYKTNEMNISKSFYFNYITYGYCFCHLFLEDTKTAIQIALEYFSDPDSTVIYDLATKRRFIDITTYIIDQNYDAATRELTNYKKSSVFKSDEREWTRVVVALYERYLSAIKCRKKERASLLQQLYSELDQLSPQTEVLSLQFPWLKRKVAKEMVTISSPVQSV